MRTVLHDWSDEKCHLILQNIVQAMSAESVILIDEMILPDTNVHWRATQIDLLMMGALASMERTRSQWDTLLDAVGLKVRDIYTYNLSTYDNVMAVVRK